jgi:galactokinase
MDETRIALLCQKAEHEYALVPCGIMDQTIVAAGKAGHAMLLDCRDNSKQFVPIDPNELRVVIVNSMVKHELSGGEYAERRKQCEEGVGFFKQSDPEREGAARRVDATGRGGQGKARRRRVPPVSSRCRRDERAVDYARGTCPRKNTTKPGR